MRTMNQHTNMIMTQERRFERISPHCSIIPIADGMNSNVILPVRKSEALRIHSGRTSRQLKARNKSIIPMTLPGTKCPMRDERISPATRNAKMMQNPATPTRRINRVLLNKDHRQAAHISQRQPLRMLCPFPL